MHWGRPPKQPLWINLFLVKPFKAFSDLSFLQVLEKKDDPSSNTFQHHPCAVVEPKVL